MKYSYIFCTVFVINLLICFNLVAASLDEDTDFILDLQNHSNYNLLPEDCGLSFSDRIIGGNEVSLGRYPWLARLGYKLSKCARKILYRCTGSLINENYIVTVAHCVTNLPIIKCPTKAIDVPFVLTSIVLGEHNTLTEPDCVGEVCAAPTQHFKPGKILLHAKYNVPQYANDICMIRLDRRAELNGWVAPVCLPRGKQLNNFYTGKIAEVAGWGTTNLEKPGGSKVPMVVQVPIVEVHSCLRSFTKPINLSKRFQMCAGGEENKDSCAGDSGTPLMIPEAYDGPPRYYALGMVSFGVSQCGKKDKPAIYTRLAGYMGWILNNMKP